MFSRRDGSNTQLTIGAVTDWTLPYGYDTSGVFKDDLAVARVDQSPVALNDTVGVVVYLRTDDLLDAEVEAAGYPKDSQFFQVDNSDGGFIATPAKATSKVTGFSIPQASGDEKRYVAFDDRMDSFPGFSGAGFWIDHDGEKFVAGQVVSGLNPDVNGDGNPDFDGTTISGGVVIDYDAFHQIYSTIETDLQETEADTALAPRNLIVGDSTGTVVGTNSDRLNGTHRRDIFEGAIGDEFFDGNGGDDEIHGGGGADHLWGGDGNDQLFGGDGIDHLTGGAGVDTLTGGADHDWADYSGAVQAVEIYHLDTDGFVVEGDGHGTFDTLVSIEELLLSPHDDQVKIGADFNWLAFAGLGPSMTVNFGGGLADRLDLSDVGQAVTVSPGPSAGYYYVNEKADSIAKPGKPDILAAHFEELVATGHRDEIRITDPGITVYGGANEDKIFAGAASELFGGNGVELAQGRYADDGVKDEFHLASGALVKDASIEDRAYFAGMELRGGVGEAWREEAHMYWTPGGTALSQALGTLSSGAGTLALLSSATDFLAGMMVRYEAGTDGGLLASFWNGRGGSAGFENYDINHDNGEATAGITAIQLQATNDRDRAVENLGQMVSLIFNQAFGYSGTDPLVLDLDGDGIEVGRYAAYFEMTGDGFAERTDWVWGGDGFLAWDQDASGTIDGIGELFGDADTLTFVVMATSHLCQKAQNSCLLLQGYAR